jgi:hypothetical protein
VSDHSVILYLTVLALVVTATAAASSFLIQ